MDFTLLSLAVLPGLAISYYIWWRDKHEPEPHKYLIACFLFGILSIIPAIVLETIGMEMGYKDGPNIYKTFIFAVFVVGFSEEFSKYLFLRYYIFPKKEFCEPMDGIVYGVAASLGFASLENLHYVYFRSSEFGLEEIHTAIFRAFTAVPMHGLVGCVMGFYFGLLAFTGNYKFLGYALVVPIIFHGTYNFLLSYNFFYAFFIVIILLIFAIKLHNIVKTQQSYKKIESEKKKFI
jgi:RsiW-degrading membrane proteinase PrsW (M82 family)